MASAVGVCCGLVRLGLLPGHVSRSPLGSGLLFSAEVQDSQWTLVILARECDCLSGHPPSVVLAWPALAAVLCRADAADVLQRSGPPLPRSSLPGKRGRRVDRRGSRPLAIFWSLPWPASPAGSPPSGPARARVHTTGRRGPNQGDEKAPTALKRAPHNRAQSQKRLLPCRSPSPGAGRGRPLLVRDGARSRKAASCRLSSFFFLLSLSLFFLLSHLALNSCTSAAQTHAAGLFFWRYSLGGRCGLSYAHTLTHSYALIHSPRPV